MVRTIKARPVDLLDADRAAMLPLPPVPPAVGWVNRVRLGRDYYVRAASNDYSVDPGAIGQLVDVSTTLACASCMRSAKAWAEKPANTTECTAPILAQANTAIVSSGIMGM